jgi:hypothetical protein
VTYRFLIEFGEELIIYFIHGLEVVHGGDKDVKFDNASKATTSCFEYGGQVFKYPMLRQYN